MVFAIIFKVPELMHSSAGVLVRISHHEGQRGYEILVMPVAAGARCRTTFSKTVLLQWSGFLADPPISRRISCIGVGLWPIFYLWCE